MTKIDLDVTTQTGQHEVKRILLLAMQAGELMLRAGAETSRVEETINILVTSYGVKYSHSIITPTGMYVSADDDNMEYPITLVRRVRNRGMDFSRISMVNDLSRRTSRGLLTIHEAEIELGRIAQSKTPYPFWLWVLAGASTASGATLLLGGGLLDIIPTFVSSVLIIFMVIGLGKANIPAIFLDAAAAALATAFALAIDWVGLPTHTTLVIAGGIIRLVPGAALLASVLDGISGDLLSSAARALEALLKGAALAFGVGLALFAATALGIPQPNENQANEIWQIPIQVIAAAFAAASFAVSNNIPRLRILAAGLAGGVGWLTYLLAIKFWNAPLVATFGAAFVVGMVGWGLARWQHSPITLYILPGVLPLLPGITIYQGMLALTENRTVDGLVLLIQATFLGGALAAGVALSNAVAPTIWRKPRFIK